jgi:hypothetical protein
MQALVFAMNQLVEEIDPILDKNEFMELTIKEWLTSVNNSSQIWGEKPKKFGFGGVQMFILDMHFFLRVTDRYIVDESNDLANDVCAKAIKLYFVQNKNLDAPLKQGEWYDFRVDEALVKFQKRIAHFIN